MPCSASPSASCYPTSVRQLTPLNDWFIGLVKMIVVPVVFCVVTLGIATMDSLRRAGRIGVKALGYFFVLSLVSMLIGLVVANIFKPGAGMNIDVSTLDASTIPGVDSGEKVGFVQFVTNVIPDSLFGAITGHAILSALLVSLLIGCALNVTRESSAPITTAIQALSHVVFKIVGWVMWLAPDRHLRRTGLGRRQVRRLQPAATGLSHPAVHRDLHHLRRRAARPDLPGLRHQPVHADAVPEDRTAHRAEHLLQ